MSDEADLAAAFADAAVEQALANISGDIPAGTAGECDECGEIMPRLVGGRCGFCRDGRRPPLSRFESLPVPETNEMASFQLALPADDTVKQAIHNRARRDSIPLGQAALAFIKEGLERPVVVPGGDLSSVPVATLAEEIARRVANASDTAELIEAANARAAAAEARWEKLRSAFADVGVQ